LPLRAWYLRPMEERLRREEELRTRRRRESGSIEEEDAHVDGEEQGKDSSPFFDPETSLFSSTQAEKERDLRVERGEALTIAMHVALEFDGGGVFGGGDDDDKGHSSPPLSLLPPPIRIVTASSKWLGTICAYPLSGSDVGDVVRSLVGLVAGGGGSWRGKREKKTATATMTGKKDGNLACSLSLAGATLARRPGEEISL